MHGAFHATSKIIQENHVAFRVFGNIIIGRTRCEDDGSVRKRVGKRSIGFKFIPYNPQP